MFTNRCAQPAVIFAAVVGSIAIAGCGGPKVYPVRGKIEFIGGDIKLLAGSHVEALLTADPNVRASGVIQEDGTFRLEMLHGGVVRKGALPGQYRVRVILEDDDPARLRRATQGISPRFLNFSSSGVVLDVPAAGEVTVTVSAP